MSTHAVSTLAHEGPLGSALLGLVRNAVAPLRGELADGCEPLSDVVLRAHDGLWLCVELRLRGEPGLDDALASLTPEVACVEGAQAMLGELRRWREERWLDLRASLESHPLAPCDPGVRGGGDQLDLSACSEALRKAAEAAAAPRLAAWLGRLLVATELVLLLQRLLALAAGGERGDRQRADSDLQLVLRMVLLRVRSRGSGSRPSLPQERRAAAVGRPAAPTLPGLAATAPVRPASPAAVPLPAAPAPLRPAASPAPTPGSSFSRDPASSAGATEQRLDDVHFTVFRPRRLIPEMWTTFLVFTHLSERRVDAPSDEPDPLEVARRQAHAILGAQAQYRELGEDASHPIPYEGQLCFVPAVAGVEFDPPRQSFRWVSDVQHVVFRVRAPEALSGTTARGTVSAFLGNLLVGEVSLSLPIGSAGENASSAPPVSTESGRMYRKIFASYSHSDMRVVETFRKFAKTFGDQYLIDVADLRAGEQWSSKLEQLIREADVFQLFWSSRSMRSKFVRQEWEYALALDRPHFVRPTYWERPLPTAPDDDLPPAPLRALHFEVVDDIVVSIAGACAAAPVGDMPSSPSGAAPKSPSRHLLIGSAVATLLAFMTTGVYRMHRSAVPESGEVAISRPDVASSEPTGSAAAVQENLEAPAAEEEVEARRAAPAASASPRVRSAHSGQRSGPLRGPDFERPELRGGFDIAIESNTVPKRLLLADMLAENRAAIQECYLDAVRSRGGPPERPSELEVELALDGDSKMKHLRVSTRSGPDRRLSGCFRRALEAWRFPASAAGTELRFTLRPLFGDRPDVGLSHDDF